MAKKKSKTGSAAGGNGKAEPQSPPVLEAEVVGAESSIDDSVPVDDNDSGENEDEEEMELLQVDLGDMIKMKQVLDEGVSSALLDHVPEDYRWDNFKLLLMFVSCVFAMTAQFAPIPFPESRPVLGVCGSLYFVLSGILQFITTFIDKDMIMQSRVLEKTKKGDSGDSKKKDSNNNTSKINPLLYEYGLRVRSSFPRFSEFYTVILEFRIPPKDPLHGTVAQKSVKAVWSVGQFFDKEGYFDEVGLSNEVSILYKRLEAENYNGADVADDNKKAKKKTE